MQKKNELKLFLENYKKQLKQECTSLLSQRMPDLTEDLFSLFEKNGNRIIYEEVYFTRRKFLTLFGLQALIEKKDKRFVTEETLKKLTEVIETICAEECWALPAHINRKKEGWQKTIDLFASETAQTLAELADRLKEDLPASTIELILENVENRIIIPFLSALEDLGWEKADHNWNAVCAGSIGSICLHVMRDRREILDPCIRRICESLPYYVGGFSDDGVCMEGLAYYTYGMNYFVNFALELYDYTEGKQDLLQGDWAGFHKGEEDKRVRMADFYGKCFFMDGRTANFSDGNSHDKFHVGLCSTLCRLFPQVKMPNMKQAAGIFDDNCYRFVFRKLDLLETERYLKYLDENHDKTEEGISVKQSIKGVQTGSICNILPSAQWCIANSANGVGMACKGGHNGEPHNHNDVGHFIYETAEVTLLADLGAGEYTKEYFGDGRYGILCNNSFGHSVPIINGMGQCSGEDYRCRNFKAYEEGESCTVSMELSGMYPQGLLVSLYRKINFDLNSGNLEVTDEIILPKERCGENDFVVENLITQIKPKLEENQIILESQAVKASISIKGISPMSEVTVVEHDHSNHDGQLEKVYTIQWQADVSTRKGNSTFTVSVSNKVVKPVV